jgi:hypothetical protein
MDGDLTDVDVGGDLPPAIRALLAAEGVDPDDVVEWTWHEDLVRWENVLSFKLKPKIEKVEMTFRTEEE